MAIALSQQTRESHLHVFFIFIVKSEPFFLFFKPIFTLKIEVYYVTDNNCVITMERALPKTRPSSGENPKTLPPCIQITKLTLNLHCIALYCKTTAGPYR